MEKQINFLLQVYSMLLYGLIIYVESTFLSQYNHTDLFRPWFIVFFILDWLYINKMTDLLKEKTPKHL